MGKFISFGKFALVIAIIHILILHVLYQISNFKLWHPIVSIQGFFVYYYTYYELFLFLQSSAFIVISLFVWKFLLQEFDVSYSESVDIAKAIAILYSSLSFLVIFFLSLIQNVTFGALIGILKNSTPIYWCIFLVAVSCSLSLVIHVFNKLVMIQKPATCSRSILRFASFITGDILKKKSSLIMIAVYVALFYMFIYVFVTLSGLFSFESFKTRFSYSLSIIFSSVTWVSLLIIVIYNLLSVILFQYGSSVIYYNMLDIKWSEEDYYRVTDIFSNDTPLFKSLKFLDLYHQLKNDRRVRQNMYCLSAPGQKPRVWKNFYDELHLNVKHFNNILSMLSSKAYVDGNLPQHLVHQNAALPQDLKKRLYLDCFPDSFPREELIENKDEKAPKSMSWRSLLDGITQRLLSTFNTKLLNGFLIGTFQRCRLDSNTSKLNGRTLVSILRSLEVIILCSLEEDNYGIIQHDLKILLSQLISFYHNIVRVLRLHGIITIHKSSVCLADDCNFLVLYSDHEVISDIYTATRNLLTNVAQKYENYLDEMDLSEECKGKLMHFL